MLNTIIDLLPENPHLFPEDYGSNLAENSFYISEIVREKLTRTLGDEIPYELYVSVETNEVKGKSEKHWRDNPCSKTKPKKYRYW